MIPEDKWKSNQRKVDFLKTFPGLTSTWEQAHGLQLESSIPFPDKKAYTALVFSQGHFGVSSFLQNEPQLLSKGLQLVRPFIEKYRPESFTRYDHLHALDQEMGRQARLQNIMNAITNNMEAMPELKSRIRDLVRQWEP
ncbi:MAG: hypothetical protein KC563_13640 [Nitrospira sp.]|nr:hypothetical protein [Nitrospira sp.]MCA9476829.1 hypothetical protein [Nitrospira sp.]MCA9479594.1 hypothetical protein [Nitrospira sp.]MCB9711999.1 hypothetical protein [Nitrospiraceae bacterium]